MTQQGNQGNFLLLSIIRKLNESFDEFYPDLVVYNAGTDILKGDPLGRLNVTRSGIIKRDELVFRRARDMQQADDDDAASGTPGPRAVPIVMVTSGGYLRETADIIADSILNLNKKGLISWCVASRL